MGAKKLLLLRRPYTLIIIIGAALRLTSAKLQLIGTAPTLDIQPLRW